LYNDILPMEVVRREHEKLRSFLSLVARVHEFRDLLTDAARTAEGHRALASLVSSESKNPRASERLSRLDPESLVTVAVEGASSEPDTLEAYLSGDLFALDPIPNLYFMRDVAMVVGRTVVPGCMAHRIRYRESRLAEIAFRFAEPIAGSPIVRLDQRGHRLEGGDVLVIDERTLIIGVSDRTSAGGIDALVRRLLPHGDGTITVYAVLLPKTRATIHLDMVFTLIAPGVALVHEPVILGPDAVPTVRAHYDSRGAREFRRFDNLLRALDDGGIAVEPVICGGADRLRQQREQWLSGTNAFAFGPGTFLTYDCNDATLVSLEKAGFPVRPVDRFIERTENVESYDRLAVAMEGSNLARGGGGPRCMTLPLRRSR
jgi:arginine deiminase